MHGRNPRAKNLERLCAFLVALIVASCVRAETLPFTPYTMADGLAHDRVDRIVRDSIGFLWFCTAEGLSRFDGNEFKNYTQDDGLPHRAIRDLLETRDGKLWLATGAGLVLFDPRGASAREPDSSSGAAPMFRTIGPVSESGEQVWVEDLVEDRSGTVWVGTSAGVYTLARSDDWELRKFEIPGSAKEGANFHRLLEDSSGAIWAGSEVGLYRISADRSSAVTIHPTMRIGSMMADKEGRVWIGSVGGKEDETGLHVFRIVDGDPEKLRTFRKTDGLHAEEWLNDLLETSDGKILVGIGNGISEFVPDAGPGEKSFRTLAASGVSSLGEDVAGNLWIGTNAGGLRRLARGGFVNFTDADNIETKRVGSIVSTPRGDLFVLSESLTLHWLDGNKFVSIKPKGMFPQSWGRGRVSFVDRSGAWWIAGDRGLQRYPAVARPQDMAHTEPIRSYTTADGLFSNVIFQLLEDSRGDIWIGTINHPTESLSRWERSTDKIHSYSTAEFGLPVSNPVTAFAEDLAGNIWIGHYSGGLVRYRRDSEKFESFKAEENLPAGYIGNIFTDSAGRIWVATNNGGVVRIDDPTSDRPLLKNITTRDGLSSNHATCTTEDKFGRIYVSTGRGVNRLDLQNGRTKIFTKADGLPDNIVTQCGRDASGALWFGTWEGASRYVPAGESQSSPPPVFLANLRVNGQPVTAFSQLGESSVADLDFASDQRQIQVDFFALGFGVGESLRYQYKLDGIDDDWSDPSPQRMVNLGLSSGSYRFLVRAVNAEGVASANPAVLSFSIARPFWQQWWFLLIIAVAVSLAGYLLYRYRLAQLIKLERVRTRIASDLHDDIGSSLSQIAILSEVARHKAGDNGAAEPLRRIAETSRDMVDSMSDIVWAINPQKDHLSDLIHRMRRFASDTFDSTDVGYKFNFDESTRDISLGADIRREVYLIFKECVNNTAKHSGADHVDISIETVHEVLRIRVADNGAGFDVARKMDGGANGFGGNGLPNMRRRAVGLGGEFTIESGDTGTTVLIEIPMRAQIPSTGIFAGTRRVE